MVSSRPAARSRITRHPLFMGFGLWGWIAGDIGLSVPTVKNHYQLLEDMFLGSLTPSMIQDSVLIRHPFNL